MYRTKNFSFCVKYQNYMTWTDSASTSCESGVRVDKSLSALMKCNSSEELAIQNDKAPALSLCSYFKFTKKNFKNKF